MTQPAFGNTIRQRGFESVRVTRGVNKGRKAWRGLRVRSDAAAHAIVNKLKAKMSKRK